MIDRFLVNVYGGLTTRQTYSGVYELAEIILTTKLVCLPGFTGEFCENFTETFLEDTTTANTDIAPSTDTDTTDMDITPSTDTNVTDTDTTDMDITSLDGTSDLVKIIVGVVICAVLVILIILMLSFLYSRKKKKSVKSLGSVIYHVEAESELGPAPHEERFSIIGSVSLLYN